MSFDDILDPRPYRWPKKDVLPFRETKGPDTAGPLAADGLTRAVSIMDGFMLAGVALADQALKERFQRYDLVYPMLFCYRHAVAVGLKWLIQQYGPLVGVTPKNLSKNHVLLDLWRDCLRIYEARGASSDDEALKAVGRVVEQFDDWDKRGTTFRYASTQDGAVVRFLHRDIDIDNLKDVMSGIANFFSGSDGWLSSIENA